MFGAAAPTKRNVTRIARRTTDARSKSATTKALTAPVTAGLVPLFLVFFKVGAVLFGSGYVLLAFLHDDLVTHWHWLGDDLCSRLPPSSAMYLLDFLAQSLQPLPSFCLPLGLWRYAAPSYRFYGGLPLPGLS